MIVAFGIPFRYESFFLEEMKDCQNARAILDRDYQFPSGSIVEIKFLVHFVAGEQRATLIAYVKIHFTLILANVFQEIIKLIY